MASIFFRLLAIGSLILIESPQVNIYILLERFLGYISKYFKFQNASKYVSTKNSKYVSLRTCQISKYLSTFKVRVNYQRAFQVTKYVSSTKYMFDMKIHVKNQSECQLSKSVLSNKECHRAKYQIHAKYQSTCQVVKYVSSESVSNNKVRVVSYKNSNNASIIHVRHVHG